MKEDTDLDDVHVPSSRYVFSKKTFESRSKFSDFFSFSFMKIEFNEQNSEISLANLQDTSFNQK